MLKRLAADALGWWRALRAAGDAPTLASLRAVLRPAPVAAAVAVVAPSAAELYLEYQASIRARGYAAHTLRARKMFGSWMAAYEAASGERLTPSTYDLAAHDRVLSFLRFDRNLALNTVAAYVRGFKTFLRWCRDERGLA